MGHAGKGMWKRSARTVGDAGAGMWKIFQEYAERKMAWKCQRNRKQEERWKRT